MTIDEAAPDNMNVVHSCAAGLDIHKLSAAASVRVWKGCVADGDVATRTLPATALGFREVAGWLSGCKVTAAAMEATGIGGMRLWRRSRRRASVRWFRTRSTSSRSA